MQFIDIKNCHFVRFYLCVFFLILFQATFIFLGVYQTYMDTFDTIIILWESTSKKMQLSFNPLFGAVYKPVFSWLNIFYRHSLKKILKQKNIYYKLNFLLCKVTVVILIICRHILVAPKILTYNITSPIFFAIF